MFCNSFFFIIKINNDFKCKNKCCYKHVTINKYVPIQIIFFLRKIGCFLFNLNMYDPFEFFL